MYFSLILPLLSLASAALPPSYTVTELGTTFDNNFPNVYRDNGGGGSVGGINYVVFSDTAVTNGGRNGDLVYFVSNSIAVMDYVSRYSQNMFRILLFWISENFTSMLL